MHELLTPPKKPAQSAEPDAPHGGGFGVGWSLHTDGGVDTQLQELRGSIRVYCRIRPTFKPSEQVAACSSEGALGLDQVEVLDKARNWKAFTFDRVFGPKTSQVPPSPHSAREPCAQAATIAGEALTGGAESVLRRRACTRSWRR